MQLMQLYFIRHGQSGNNWLWDQTQSSKGRNEDPPLTAAGRKQANLVAQFLAREGGPSEPNDNDYQNHTGFNLTHIYSSLMTRAVDTGYTVAQALDLPLIAGKDLHECGGIYLDDENGNSIGLAGKGRSYFEQTYPQLVLPDYLDEDGWWNRTYEKTEESGPRAERVVRELLERHGNSHDRVGVITHGLFYNHLLSVILKMPPPDVRGYWFVLNNCAITRIDFNRAEDVLGIIYTNRVEHLPRELIT